jgi:hypothetical protein
VGVAVNLRPFEPFNGDAALCAAIVRRNKFSELDIRLSGLG